MENLIQEEIIQAVINAKNRKEDIKQTIKKLAKEFALTEFMVKGIIEIKATEGLTRVINEDAKTDTHKWEPINYYELVGDLKERVESLERQFKHLLEGIDRVVEDGETMRAHVQQVRGMTRWMGKRDGIEMEEIKVTPLDVNKDPPLLEAEFTEPQNATADVSAGGNRGAIGVDKEIEGDKIKTEPLTTDRTNEIEILRRRIDKARARLDSHETKKPPSRLLFSGIEEGKKAIPR